MASEPPTKKLRQTTISFNIPQHVSTTSLDNSFVESDQASSFLPDSNISPNSVSECCSAKSHCEETSTAVSSQITQPVTLESKLDFMPDFQQAAAESDIAVALSLRCAGQLTSEQKLRFIRSTLKVGPQYKFPYTKNSNRKYYASYKHISERNNCFYFSPCLNGLLCLPCVLFAPDKVGRGQSQVTGRLVTKPLTDFSKLTGKDSYLTTHLERYYHEDAVTRMNALKQSSVDGDVAAKLDIQYAQQIARNRAILRAVICEIETCGRMNLALRGHRDSGPINTSVDCEHIDYTQGNLRCLVQKAAVKDSLLRDHLNNGPKNASYLSAETQNNLINCIGTVMLRQICSEITKSKFFAIGADETSDVHKIEQLVLTVRYVDANYDICESFVGFVEVKNTTGHALAESLLGYIEKIGLDKRYIVAQGYDGASAMSGIYNGTQALIKNQCPSAIYIHCAAHCLNLVLSKSVDIIEIRAAITGVQSACMFFKHSAKRVDEMQEAIERLCPTSRHMRLKQYCATRWVERHDSIFIFLELYEPLLEVLTRNREFALVSQITEPQFIVSVLILNKILGLTKGASQSLQAKQLDLISAVNEIESVTATLASWRTGNVDAEYNSVFKSAEELYAKIENSPGIEFPKPRLAGRQLNRNNVPAANASEYYKRAVWYPLLDSMIAELRARFNSHSKIAMHMCALIPAKCTDSNFASLAKSLEIFGCFLEDGAAACEAEFERWQRKWTNVPCSDRPATVCDAMKACDGSIYPNIAVLLQIFATVPVSTATAERSFSALRLLKTYLRSTMNEERLTGLALMAIHKDVRFKYDDVIDQYALQHNHRFKFH